MLQPRRNIKFVLLLFVLVDCLEGFEYDINETPRRKRQDEKDLTTVLLVDSRGRSSFGRFLSVKPDLGLITSTARTFIQEGVTTEYATQVLGTTLDNGRLYAHLLTKSSRVLYDDSPTKAHDLSNKKWNLNENLISPQQFIRNIDYISPNKVDSIQVFPTKLGYPQVPIENNRYDEILNRPQEIIEEEILKESPSNNYRVPFDENRKNIVDVHAQNNVKVFKISPQIRDITHENVINHKETNDKPLFNDFTPSKVKPWENLPTFTVRNEFSPSGLSFLGDLPDFEEHTERAKLTTPTERKAKLLFRAGLAKPNSKDLTSITYSGFADFTTTVGDTVIIFSPHTTNEVQKPAGTTKISVEPTLIQPTTTLQEPPLATQIKTFLSREPPMETKTFKGPKLEMKTSLPTMVIDKTDRTREPKSGVLDELVDMDAKSSVLAREQGQEQESSKVPITFTSDLIQPSESKPTMLSTPSDEDIAKIFASLQALAKQSTEPLKSQSTIIFDSPKENVSGATTIFFDDDLPIETSSTTHSASTKSADVKMLTTTERDITTYQITTEEVTEKQHTTLKEETITEDEILTTSENIISTTPLEAMIPEPKKGENKLADVICTGGTEVVPSTVYKTLTYLTTFFIPTDGTTTTSVKSNEVVSTETTVQTRLCDYASLSPESETFEPNTEEITTFQETKVTTPIPDVITEEVTEEEAKSTPEIFETIPHEITTESRFVTESESESTDATTEDGDEVELIFKTLYTTYTYLTTYFQETTSSIASRIVVTTNVITSTLDPGNEATDDAVSGLFDNDRSLFSKYKSKTVTFEDVADIDPSNIETVVPTISYNSENFEDLQESVLAKPTPILDDNKLLQTANGVKTYYTTYTYFTTIFVDGETEISSRTEVYTNFVTPSFQTSLDEDILPTNVASIGEGHTERQPQDDEVSIRQKISKLNIKAQNNYNTINRKKPSVSENESDNEIYATVGYKSVDTVPTSVKQATDYVTLERGISNTENEENTEKSSPNLSEYETIATMVTDVRSSTSEGDRRIIDNVDDQIVSESNNDSEIIPSPTLLLQTSYTTFTYFTTMYHGTTSSNVVSRLETITNVVTQTLTPTHTLTADDLTLPVTYFTTFTYWTTLYKDGTTKITSREETVSNIETPSIEATEMIQSTPTSVISTTAVTNDILPTASENIVPSSIGDDDLTTYFTTYTYYTTSYIGNDTVLKSRLETVTNVLNNTLEISNNQIGRSVGSGDGNKLDGDKSKIELSSITSTIKPTGLLSTIVNTLSNDGITTILSTDVYGTYIDGLYAKVLESTSSILTGEIKSSPVKVNNLEPTGVVSINKGKIVDAEGVSTLFYTTQAVGTYIDNIYAQVTESTSSLAVDEEKKAALPTDLPIAHRTGLVRLIEGSIIQKNTTTFYESKVLGTNIDGRYAQIIESTSSFLVGSQASLEPSNVKHDITPSPTNAPEQILVTTEIISPSPVAIEGSITDTTKGDDVETSTEDNDDENNEKDGGKTKKRLTFQSRKRTSTPAIRPFASRQRPTFAPKRKLSGQSTAATITRSDFTPTVTAVLASKSNRFNGRRSSSGVNAIQPTASGSRRFSRPKSTSNGNGFGSTFGSGRRSSSNRIQPTISGSSSRRAGFRSSSFGASIRPSSLFGGRPRIRPTLASGLIRSASSNVVARTPSNVEDDLTTIVTEEPTDITGEDSETTLALQSTTEISSSKRNQNPLLRFRRPPLAARATSNPRSTTVKTGKNIPKKFTTTTTTKPKTAYNRPSSLLNRPRPNALFPRRGLFTTTTNPPEAEDEGEEEDDDDVIDDSEDLDEEGEPEEDTDYDSSSTNTQILNPPTAQTTEGSGSNKNNVQIRPFFRKRFKRNTYSRFRRPSSTVSSTENLQEERTEKPQKPSGRGRYSNKSRNAKTSQSSTSSSTNKRPRISPSKSSQPRTQFTLRENDKKSNFKRPTTTGRSNRPTPPSRPKTPKLRNNHQTEAPTNYRKSSTSNRQNSRTNNRVRNTQRQKYQNNENTENNNFVLPSFDGTITITHQIPVEVTIPVVNGKITEYKNIVTAKLSTEVLNPLQYSTSLNAFGKEVKVLLSENTAIGNNGATIITQFVLNETPTTSIIFTPTYINRRKTSYSHLVPSTIYEVEQVVNTIQPALAAQAPLANILLSQLLLGGLQPQQNALLGLQQPGLAPGTPTTEYKTKTTTYVTTITRETSTVIPLTFRGKEIFTTIIDSSVSVLTATEFLTDTVVVTPTLGYQGSQLNTALLLPLLQQQLQQQQQQQQQLQQQQQQLAPNILLPQQPANVFNFDQPEIQALYKEQEKLNLALDNSEELQETAEIIQSSRRKTPRRGHKNKPAPVEPSKETSVITLYVSGRTPGEFTSILSTITVGEESARKRRDLEHVPVQPSMLPPGTISETSDIYDSLVMPTKESLLEVSEIEKETESLESIIGDVPKYMTTQTPELFDVEPSKTSKSSKNINDLSKVAPLLPKVETSLEHGVNLTNSNFNVSKIIGKKILSNHSKLVKRIRRELSETSDTITAMPNAPKRKRIVKKLIRIQPIPNETSSNSRVNDVSEINTEPSKIDVTTRRIRRRLKIKKKKKLIIHHENRSDIDDVEQVQQATKSRRKIVITRKRILPNINNSKDMRLLSEAMPSSIIESGMQSTVVKSFSEILDHSVYDNKFFTDTDVNDVDENYEDIDNDDVETDENFDEIYDEETDDDDDELNYDNEDYGTEDYHDHSKSTQDYDIENDDESVEEEINTPRQNKSTINSTALHSYITDEKYAKNKNSQEPDVEGDERNSEFSEGKSFQNNDIILTNNDENGEYLSVPSEDVFDVNNPPTFQDIPEYEPSFPELTESLDAPVLLLKTTVLSSTELLTRTVTESKLRTYTFVITRVSGDEQIITSTTEVKPQIKTSIFTDPQIKYTTLTLLNFDATQTLTDFENTLIPTLDNPQSQLLNQENGSRNFNEEARYNLATRIMSNGVEVIVAGDKKSVHGEHDFKRLLSTGIQKPVTLKPSTLTDHMVMMLPQEESNIESLTSSLYPNQFVTKTCLTTFTYLTTYLEGSTTTVSSHEQVISNVATEERNTGKILPTPAMGVTLTQFPNLSVGVFHTTYTYLNTLLDGEQPLVLSSEHTVTNTVTAPDDYLSLMKPSEMISAMKDTNTYYSTIGLEKTLYEGDKTSVISTREVVTQVVITESVPPRATSVMTSYIALDMEDNPSSISSYTTTDVVKTYFVTYTYYNTLIENGKEVVKMNISTSSDIVTEQLYLLPKKTSNIIVMNTPLVENNATEKMSNSGEQDKLQILSTKSYFTTFTYFTTLLQEKNEETPTVISSRTKVIENVVTEVVNPNLLDKSYLNEIRKSIDGGHSKIVTLATLLDGQKLEITASAVDSKQKIEPTKTLPIEKTEIPELKIRSDITSIESSSPSIITGSTIVFIDDDPFAQLAATPTLITSSKIQTLGVNSSLGSLLSSEVIDGTKMSITSNKSKRSTKSKLKNHYDNISPTKTKTASNKLKTRVPNQKPTKIVQDNQQGTPVNKTGKPGSSQSNLLGLGSININSLQALTPVLNAMAGLISTNLKTNRRNDVNITTASTTTSKSNLIHKADGISSYDTQNRSPIYIPVGGLSDDFEIAESQNIATFDWVDPPSEEQVSGESLLNGGIPISPGEIITANSDVIVGKPGRIGPRIPSIPLHHVTSDNEIPIGMKPPPVPKNAWRNKNHEYRHIPVSSVNRNKPVANIVHSPNKDDYFGPPPLLHDTIQNQQNDRKNLLQPPRETIGPSYGTQFNRYEIPINQQVFAESNNNYESDYKLNEPNHEHQFQSLRETIQQNYNSMAEHSFPLYAHSHFAVGPGMSMNNFNIKPSIVNEPIILPEVIEQSTGQPLLVNIQPSQVAFVSIPYNRTTALIYGGSTEPHRNGQYFDDPSPYPEPEFSGIEFNNGVPHIASVYQGEPVDQKQVNGFIKVENQLINVDPVTSENQNIQVNIRPTRPHVYNGDHVAFGNNHEISLNVPPISFGVMHQGDDFNAHIINHGDSDFRHPATPHKIMKIERIPNEHIMKDKYPISFPSAVNNVNQHTLINEVQKPGIYSNGYEVNIDGNVLLTTNPHTNSKVNENSEDQTLGRPQQVSNQQNILNQQDVTRNPSIPNRNIWRQKPPRTELSNPELVQYMTPPPFVRNTLTKRPHSGNVPNKRPTISPASVSSQINNQHNTPVNSNYGSYPVPHEYGKPIHRYQNNEIQNRFPEYHSQFKHHFNSTTYPSIDLDVGYHRDDDLENEDGEVVQESNSRPLLPGEIPTEVLKAQRNRYNSDSPSNNTIRFPADKLLPPRNTNFNIQIPFITQNPRPFAASESDNRRPIYKAEIQNGGQMKPSDSNVISFNRFSSTERNIKNNYNTYNSDRTRPNVSEATSNLFVGNQFTNNHHSHKTLVSGTQFSQENSRNESTIAKSDQESSSSGSKLVAKNPQSNSNIFGSKIQQSIPISYPTTTALSAQKPVLIFIDETGGNEKDFFHANQKQSGKDRYKNVRPSVTSLPIDIPTFNPQTPQSNINQVDTQTEEAFVLQNNAFSPIENIQTTTEESIKKIRIPITESTPFEDSVTSDLNTGEITLSETSSNVISDMEMLRPPPSTKPLDTEIQPPSLITDTSSISEIIRTPINYRDDFIKINIKSSTEKSFTPNFLEELVPPPVQTSVEEVVGMSPPPLVSNASQRTTSKPVAPMQIDITKVKSGAKPSSATERYKYNRTKRPFTRRPYYKITTTTIPSTTRRQPVYTFYNGNIRNRTTASPIQSATEQNIIKPSPSMKIKSSMEVIIGKPNHVFEESEEAPSTTNYVEIIENGQGVELSASEISVHVQATEKTASFTKDMSDLLAVESGIPTPNFDMHSNPPTATDIITKAVHHAGNEIKIIDDPTSATTTNRNSSPTNKLKPSVSTKYITHMKTATVTITKTTVIKSQGMKPSTSTILLTTTEKRTIIDTVTEVHTLVKPTNIIQTVTTTIQQGNSLYPPEVYGSPYPSIQVKPSVVVPNPSTPTSVFDIVSNESDDDLEDFIIHDTDPTINSHEKDPIDSNESILVVISDKNTKNIIPVPNNSYEIQERDEMIATNKVNNVLLGGILIANHPVPAGEKEGNAKDKCEPECKPSRNELCQKLDSIMRCVCRPGFARMFPDRPCLPTYTFELNITLERIGKDTLHFFDDLRDSNSTEFNKFAHATREGLNRMVMQSDLRDIFHGVKVHSFEPAPKGIVSKFYLQLSDNIEDARLTDIFQKYLRNNNHSLGGTDIFASASDVLVAEDFDECSFPAFNDCSENAQCFNLKGTYTCSCKEGFSDLSENMVYPGRVCSAEQVGCERCSYHGTCYSRGGNEVLCECFQWYTGESCQINLKVLLIALATLGIILFILLLICIFSACFKSKTKNARHPSGMMFMPQRTANCGSENTLDRRAMIQDTSSEDSRSETNETVPYIQEQTKKPKTALKKFSKVSMQISDDVENGDNNVSFMEQKDRSLTVMIPRAKYHPASVISPLMNYTTFDARKPSVPSTTNETKLLSYLDAGPSPNKSEPSRKLSKTPSDSIVEEKPSSRKTSGALISAGFEVSATVVNNMGTLGTTCGTEADRSENATLIQRISTDLLSSTGTRSQFNTLRKSLIDEDLENSTHWLDMVPRVMTVSEARSYDETTIPPPMKSFRTAYDSKPPSQQPNDEANTMAERDLGSTFLLPHTHLYNPDRGSDISGFESL